MLLRTKLLLFAGFCALIPIILSTFWSARIASESIENELRQRSLEVLNQVSALTRDRIDSMFSYSFLVKSNPALPLAIENRNSRLVSSVSRSIRKGLNLDIFEVMDRSARLVYSAEDTSRIDTNRISTPFISQLFKSGSVNKGSSFLGVEKRSKGVAVEIATLLPSLSHPYSGAVLMGFYLDDSFFRKMKKVMNADFCLFSGDQVIATTFEENKDTITSLLKRPLNPVHWDRVSNGKSVVEEISLSEEPYIFALKRMDFERGDLSIAVFHSSRNAFLARRKAWLSIGLVGTLGITAAVLLAIVLSQRLMTPIKSLTRAIDEVGKGNFETKVRINSRDEIGFLSYAFNSMSHSLKEAQEKLIRTERLAAIGQMASGVGHELRNPLAAIKNAIYFVRGKLKKNLPGGDESIERMLTIAESEIAATVKISNDLLEFSRSIRINPTKVDLTELINHVLGVISIPPNVKLDKSLPDQVPPVFVDQERMRQVFINLINNGIEAMPKGGALQIEMCYNNGGLVDVYVRDTGSGIKEDDQEKIFEPLFSTKSKGTGLGLSIVRTIVDAHRGQIMLKSEVGKGTEFLVRVPVYMS